MRANKVVLLAGMSLTFVAFAMPSTAFASTTITKNHTSIGLDIIESTGKVKFELLGSGIECEVRADLRVATDEIDVSQFEFSSPTFAGCTFFGSIYGGCQFEQDPVTTNLPWGIDLIEGKPELTLTNSTNTGSGYPPGVIDTELKAQTGKTCNITTNDLTLVHEPTSSTVTVDVILDANGAIESLKLTGKVKVDSGSPAGGTSTANHLTSVASVAGSLKLSLQGTYTLS